MASDNSSYALCINIIIFNPRILFYIFYIYFK